MFSVANEDNEDNGDNCNERCDEEIEENFNLRGATLKLNYWGLWVNQILNSLSPFFTQEGSEVNAYYLSNINLKKKHKRFVHMRKCIERKIQLWSYTCYNCSS